MVLAVTAVAALACLFHRRRGGELGPAHLSSVKRASSRRSTKRGSSAFTTSTRGSSGDRALYSRSGCSPENWSFRSSCAYAPWLRQSRVALFLPAAALLPTALFASLFKLAGLLGEYDAMGFGIAARPSEAVEFYLYFFIMAYLIVFERRIAVLETEARKPSPRQERRRPKAMADGRDASPRPKAEARSLPAVHVRPGLERSLVVARHPASRGGVRDRRISNRAGVVPALRHSRRIRNSRSLSLFDSVVRPVDRRRLIVSSLRQGAARGVHGGGDRRSECLYTGRRGNELGAAHLPLEHAASIGRWSTAKRKPISTTLTRSSRRPLAQS